MRNHLLSAFLFLFIITGCQNKKEKTTAKITTDSVWTVEKANEWYGDKGWLVGSNYTPAYAINQLEFWQADTFNPDSIDKELTLAEGLGMNTMRVYLHDLLYDQDAEGFLKRMDTFLEIAAKHHIKPMFVLFDSCWDPFPKSGKQRDPKPHVHNSGWVQSPGLAALKDSTQYPRLQKYVEGVVGKFANDDRILAWDIWNEPDNTNGSSYGNVELPNKSDYVTPLLTNAFTWARAAKASQPLTSAVWGGDWSTPEKLSPLQKVQIEESDIISFHNYENTQLLEKCINWLQQYNRPIICTEYMARPNGSTFESSLPVAKKYNVGMYNWGFVDGKTQTIYPWDSWKKQYNAEPPVWFHDIFRKDGTPYRKKETDLIRKMTGAEKETKY
ncbi:MAG: cellulase family glycosylhydrolase [Sphingobacteriaceae bacterium]